MSENNSNKAKSKGWKREILEWVLVLSFLAFIYLMGWHTEIFGRFQQALLWTGIIQPDIELSEEEIVTIDYDMPLLTLEGKQANLSDFKGEVIFLNFWATWCPPCIAEMPNIQSLYEEYGSKEGLTFVMVSLDESPSRARKFLDKRDFTFGSFMLNGARPTMLRSEMIPTTFVINKEGKIVSRKRGMANYNTASFKFFLEEQLAD